MHLQETLQQLQISEFLKIFSPIVDRLRKRPHLPKRFSANAAPSTWVQLDAHHVSQEPGLL